MADLRIDLAAEFKGKKAFKEADQAVGGLDKSVGKLGKQIASVFAVQKILAFGKASVKAFAEDQASAARLTKTVNNLGLAFANPAITQFIQKLSMQSGIVDETLRPAFQGLLTTTGDVTKSMDLLTKAVDISRGSGVDLATVTQDLSNGYVGITRGLKKYNLGLSQAQLKSKSFQEIMVLLNKQFNGSSAAYLETYAGKMAILNTAADNAKETIGKGLVDALVILGGKDGNVQDVADAMQNLATYTSDAVVGTAELIKQLGQIPGLSGIGEFLKGAFLALPPLQAISALANKGKTSRAVGYGDYSGSTVDYQRQQDEKAAARAKAIADKKARNLATQTLKNQKTLTAEQKKQAALKKAGTVFDLEQIGIVAALKGQLTEDEKIRLQAQLAILNDNDVLAASLTKQILLAQDSTGNLYKFFLAIGDAKIKNPFAFLDDWIKAFQDKLNNLKFPDFSGTLGGGTGGSSSGKKKAVVDPTTNPFNFPIGVNGGIGITSIQPTVSANLAIQDTFNAVMIDALAAGNNYTQSAIQALSSARYEALAQSYGLGGTTNGLMQIELKITGDGDLTNAIASSLQQQSLSTGNPAYVNRRTGGFE
jgi:hypothetical protein